MSEHIEPDFTEEPSREDARASEERVDAARKATGYNIRAGAMAMRKTVFGWATRHERPLSALSMVGGFAFDNYAYRRIDLPNTQIHVHGLSAASPAVVDHDAASLRDAR